MAYKTILDRKIDLYTPLDPDRKCVALIRGFPMIFKGDTPLSAKKTADDWRKAEYERLARPDARKKADTDA